MLILISIPATLALVNLTKRIPIMMKLIRIEHQRDLILAPLPTPPAKTYPWVETLAGKSRKHLLRNNPAQSCTPIIPNMKNTKKHNSNTLPNIGRVSRSSMTRIRIPSEAGQLLQGG